MGTATGIELGPDSCVLVAVRPRRGGAAQVSAFHMIERAEWPAPASALAAALLLIRRTRRLPRRARVVAWGVPEGTTLKAYAAAGGLKPLQAAGFRVEALLSPPEALALLAASGQRPGATAWLSLNIQGAAIAIVRAGELLFSRTFTWNYTTDLVGPRAQLLQRYSLVAQLAPEIRRGLAAVRLSHEETVTTAVTCGDLPELRSLTMPLIEELDLEVETLDSTEGLEAVGKARMERFAESAPALRLACAAALAPAGRAVRIRASSGRLAAAAAILAAAAGLGAWMLRSRPEPPGRPPAREVQATPRSAPAPRVSQAAPPAAAPAATPAAAPAATPATSGGRMPGPPTAAAPAATPVPPAQGGAPAGSGAASPARPAPSVQTRLEPPPQAPAPPRAIPSPAPPPVPAPLPPAPAAGRSSAAAPPLPPAVRPEGGVAAGEERRPPVREERRPPARRQPAEPAPLREPLPRLDSVLIDQERRLAVIDGRVAVAGDTVGSRTLDSIGPDGVVLREPSGLLVKIGLRPAPAGQR